MKQVVQDFKTGEIKIIDAPWPAPESRSLLIQNLFSVVSAGTERATVSIGKQSLIGKARSRPDLVKQVLQNIKREGVVNTFQKVRTRLDSYKALGYSSAGIILEAGRETSGFSPGDLVACGGTEHAVHAQVICVPQNLCVRCPSTVGADLASFTTLGAIALQGIRQGELTLGETVVVVGLGLVGLLTAQIAKAAGCKVVGIDVRRPCVDLALALGADATFSDPEDAERAIVDTTRGRGADAIFLTASTKSNDPLDFAARIARDRARIVVVGNVGMNVPRSEFYAKELELRLSRSYGPGRYDPVYEDGGIDYPIGYVRWTENRNMESFLELIAARKVAIEKLITHRFPIDRAGEAYEKLLGKKEEFTLGMLIEYPGSTSEDSRQVWIKPNVTAPKGKVNVGVIGAGNFARSRLLPPLKSHPEVVLRAVATATSASGRKVTDAFGFGYCAGHYDEIMKDGETNAVVIATRHGLHARLVVEAIKASKAIFVEKPLALHEKELEQVIKAYVSASAPRVMVGFNRRFAPCIQALREWWGPKRGPRMMYCRVNAGPLPRDHWYYDPLEGGGRWIGEGCHFVDLLQYLAEAPPISVYGEKTSHAGNVPDEDNVSVTVKFADGSVGTVMYCGFGDPQFPKESVEVFGDGRAARIEDYHLAVFSVGGRHKTVRTWKQDKGHTAELQAFVESILKGLPCPVPFEEACRSMQATFKALDSIATGKPVDLRKI